MWKLSWIPAVVLVLDQITKKLAVTYLLGHAGIEIAPVLKLVLVYNTGAAFGFLNDAGGWQNVFLITMTALVSLGIMVMLRRLGSKDIQVAVALWLILGGALGNLADRVLLGYVVDFIDVYYRAWHWPTFNIADSAITIGAVLLVMDALGLRLGRGGRSEDGKQRT